MGTSSSEKRNFGGLTMTYGIVARINMHNPPFWYRKGIKNTFVAFQGFRLVPFKLSEVQWAKHDPWKTRYHVARGLSLVVTWDASLSLSFEAHLLFIISASCFQTGLLTLSSLVKSRANLFKMIRELVPLAKVTLTTKRILRLNFLL